MYVKKGYNGYVRRKKILLAAEVITLLAGIIGFMIIGIITTKSRKNLMTVAAIVTVIPMVNQLVVLIALFKYKSRPADEYEEVKKRCGNGILDTELVITSKTDKSFMVDYAYIHERGIICYSFDKTIDSKKAQEYIESFIEKNSLKSDVFFIRDWKHYLARLEELEPCDRNTCDEKLLKIEGVLRGISI